MNPRTLALFASLSLLAGCKTVHVLGPDQLQKLDGYDVADTEQPRQLETTSGEVVTFGKGDALHFVRPTSTARSGRVLHITARPDLLVATLVKGRSFSVDLQPVTEVHLVTPSPLKTTLLVVGSILLGSAAVTGLVVLTGAGLNALSHISWGGRWF